MKKFKYLLIVLGIVLLSSCATSKPTCKNGDMNKYHKDLQAYYQKQQQKHK